MMTKEKPEESEEIVTTLPLVVLVEEEELEEDPQEINLLRRRKVNLPQPLLNDHLTLQNIFVNSCFTNLLA